MPRRRRYSNEPQKPTSVYSYITGGIGVVTLLLCALMIYSSAMGDGNTPAIFALLGVFSILATFIGTIVGYRLFKDDTHTFESRILGLLAPLISFLVWTSVYVYGMIAV